MEEQPSRKFERMLEWLLANDGYFRSLKVPVKFPDGEIGIAATQDIPARTAIICVPSRCIISVRKSLESELKPIFLKYEHIFSMEKVSDAEFNILAVFLFFELLKNDKSFYYPYFECLPQGDFTMIDWTPESVAACRSPFLKGESSFVGEELLRIYREIKSQIFDTEEIFTRFNRTAEDLQSLFCRAYNIVMTRCYGWSLPSTCLIPLADMCNHSDVQNTTHYIVHRQYQIHPETKAPEYILKKEHLDLSLMGVPSPSTKPTKLTNKFKFVKKYVQRRHRGTIEVDSNADEAILNGMIQAIEAEQLETAKSFNELELYETSDDEDNDTDEEEKEKKKSIMTDLRCKEIQINKNKKAKLSEKSHPIDESEGFETNPHCHEEQVEKPAIEPKEDSDKSDSLEESDWNWLEQNDKEWYFVVTTEGPIRQNQQIYNNYGERTNRFLMMWYGFCPSHNKYDSYSFRVELDSAEKWPLHELPEHMLYNGWIDQELRGKEELVEQLRAKHLSKEFRLKQTLICLDFIRFLRMWLLRLYKNFDEVRCFQIPTSVDYEIFVFQFCLLVLVHILEKDFNQKLTGALQPSNHFQVFAKHYRTSQNRIVHEQRNLVRECLNVLVNIKKGAKLADFKRVIPLENIRRILPYLKELELYL